MQIKYRLVNLTRFTEVQEIIGSEGNNNQTSSQSASTSTVRFPKNVIFLPRNDVAHEQVNNFAP